MSDMNDMNDMNDMTDTPRVLEINPVPTTTTLVYAAEANRGYEIPNSMSDRMSEPHTEKINMQISDENAPHEPPPTCMSPPSTSQISETERLPTTTPRATTSRRQTGRKNARAKTRPNHRKASEWIVQYHDAWTRLTLAPFFEAIHEQTLLPSQYSRWVLDMTSVSMTLLEAATRTGEMLKLRQPGAVFPVLHVAKENAEFMAQYAAMNGYDIGDGMHVCPCARRLVDVLETTTAPGVSLVIAMTVVWAYMLMCWQAWSKSKSGSLPPHFAPIADFLARPEAIESILDTESLLDEFLTGGASELEYEKAGKAFEQVTNRSYAVLEYTVSMSEGSHVPSCTCGRKGHYPPQCTFKSHI